MYLPLSVELKSILEEINKIPETPMDDEFWNTPEMLDVECIDLDTDGDQLYTINFSPDGKTYRQVDRCNDYVVYYVLVGPELFGRIDKLYSEALRAKG